MGKLYTSDQGNQLGQIFGDEYYADLDLIEIVERGKVRILSVFPSRIRIWAHLRASRFMHTKN